MRNDITRDEARQRADLLRVRDYRVELDLTSAATGARNFRSTSTIRFDCRIPGEDTFCDITADRVVEATLNGQPVDGSAFTGNRLALSGLRESNELRVVADCVYMRTGEGLHRFVDPVDGAVYLYTQFETFDAHRVFACFDQPDLKAEFTLRVLAPEDWKVVSNTGAEVTRAGDGTASWGFRRTPPIASYVTAVVAGPYHEVRAEHDGIPLGLFCRATLAEHLDAEELFTVTRQGFDFFHGAFGRRYPFEKYDQLFVPEFNAGAMENVGCVTILEDYVFRSKETAASYERRAETVLHELAHMWFGNLVTMRWWDDLWLNESFATFVSVLAQAEATRYTAAWTTFANIEKSWAYRQDQLPSAHPIAADIPDNEAVKVNFDGITYAKGASVLKQLTAWVGREAFFRGMRAYFERYAFGNTTLTDLLRVLEEASGRELAGWSKEWLQTAGVNTLRPAFEVDQQDRFSSFAVLQEAPEEHPVLRSHRLGVGLYRLTDAGLVRTHRTELDVVGPRTEVPRLVGQPVPDLVLLNDDDLAYTKIRLDEQSMRTLIGHLGDFADSLPRALCWAAAWDMTRDAELAARDYAALVRSGVGRESDIGLVQSAQRLTLSALTLFGAPENREHELRAFADFALAALGRAGPGGDHQLAWARAFASAATGADHQDRVADWLAGRRLPDGLVVDTELRWHLLQQLVIAGRAGDPEIAAELARDHTAAGERRAATARAARPTAAAKEEAWALAVEREDVPNAIQASVIAGFAHIDQLDLLRPYVARYFDVVADVWEKRAGEMAQMVAVGLYPGLFVEQETVDGTDRFLRAVDPPPALRRLVVEGRAGVLRALRARQKDAAAG